MRFFSSFRTKKVVDPWGKVLLDMDVEYPSVRTVEIDLSMIEKVRQRMPIIQHRRQDLYSLTHFTNNLSKTKNNQFKSFVFFCLVPIDNGQVETLPWGQLQITTNQVFFRTKLTLALVNKKPVVPGRKLSGVSSIKKIFSKFKL